MVRNFECRIAHLVVQVGLALEHLLGSLDVEQDVGEGADGVLVAAHHHVGEAHVIVSADLTGRHARVHRLYKQKTLR